MTSAALVYRGEKPHPAHQGFAEAIDADTIGLDNHSLGLERFKYSIPEEILNGLVLPKYDVYIAEGTRPLYGLLSNQLVSDSVLVYLAADQSLYDLLNADEHESLVNELISQFGMKPLSYVFNRYIDGIMAVSEFALNYTTEIIDKPGRIAHPYIQPEVFERLGDVEPDLGSETAVTIGSYARYKGQDILVESWRSVRETFPEAELKLIGSGYPEEFNQQPGVTVCGYVEDLNRVLNSASLYIQPSRADSYPVSVLEALRAGLPPLVTNTTGNRNEARSIDDSLVVNTNAESIATGVVNYFKRGRPDLEILSERARRRGLKYNANSRKEIFRRRFHDLMSEI